MYRGQPVPSPGMRQVDMQTREEFLAGRHRWWERNKDQVNAKRRRRRSEDAAYREAHNAAVRKYRQEHLEEVCAKERMRRGRLREQRKARQDTARGRS